ncbi:MULTISPECIES: KpsF/GutQ family sugar-phosphate isomerase [unclassified Marinovum]
MTNQATDLKAVAQTGRRVLQTEAQALLTLSEALPADFEAVARLLAGLEGRVIVSGIGKSGHIGRKISATMASTGTPSYFVHGAEASHGDLGMITKHDVCLLISNSGETQELRDILLHTRRFSIPLIGISSNPDSTLMKAADYKLTLPKLPEACPMGLAPTTSTTLTLALGDAVAVAVMELRGFGSEDFQVFHPGGKLGAQLSRVADLMHGPEMVPQVPADTAMNEVLITMTSKSFGIAAVVDQGKLVGVISDGDLRRNITRLMEMTAGELASPNPVTVTKDVLAVEALALLNERKIGALMVVDDAMKPVGILHIHDVLRAGVA